ncbi:MAG: NUDIX domain-containing protein [Caulobacter sp.]|nr:NUDIX domain-containing protein [Caulobacter sp.]
MSLLRRLYRLLTPAYRIAMRQVRGLTVGVRVMVFDDQGRVLLIEHSYTHGWHLPGGGVERGESAETAAARELEEEAGVRPDGRMALVSIHDNARTFRGDHVVLYRLDRWTATPATSRGEILRRDWFHTDALPAGTTEATRRRIAQVLDGTPPELFW